MRRLAAFVMSGPAQAVAAVVLTAVGGVLFPPIALLSAAAVALVVLRHGLNQGLIVAGWSALAMAVLAGLAAGGPAAAAAGLLYAAIQWLPAIVFAQVLRQTASWRTVMTGLTLFAVAVVVGAHLWVPDITEKWLDVLQRSLSGLLQRAGMSPMEVSAAIERAAHYATGVFAMSFVLSVALSLMLARAWQAQLYNPDGFRDEYTSWRLGYWLAGVAVLLVALVLLMQNDVLVELAMVVLTPFLLQAIGLMHGVVRQTGISVGWLVGMYVLLVLAPPQMGSLLAAVGVADSFANLRGRFGRGA